MFLKANFLLIFLLNLFISSILYSETTLKILPANEKKGRLAPVIANRAIIRMKSEYDNIKSASNIAANLGFTIIEQILKPEQTYKYNPQLLSRKAIMEINRLISAEEPLLRTFIVEFYSSETPEDFCSRILNQNNNIEIAEPIYIDMPLGMPNDPYAKVQSMLKVTKAFDAWDLGLNGDSSVVIGISDNGVVQEHEDIENSIAPNWGEIPLNSIDDDNNGYVDDFIGYNLAYKADKTLPGSTWISGNDHGTVVAGITGATTNNNLGIAGVANKCRIFPIKIAKVTEPSSLIYSYQSIVYAAIRGCKVLNCSWGLPKSPSEIDQSIIDFAISRDVAIVVAGGNGNRSITPYYPANYKGVLGVGETDTNDYVTSSSSLGSHIRIFAPGIGNYATTFDNSYAVQKAGGTSVAAPVVSGALGLVRARYPELSALQSIEFLRQCSDDITSKNPLIAKVLSGRLNLLKAINRNPFSIPGIRAQDIILKNTSGLSLERFSVGDTVIVTINAHNYLGSANNLRFVLSVALDYLQSIEVLDSVVNISNIFENSDFKIECFKYRINLKNPDRMIFRVDIYGDAGYHDFFMFPFIPSPEVITFSNKAIKFSVGDRGTFGFGGSSDNKQGVGFILKDYGNQLFKAGIMVTENKANLLSSLFGNYTNNNDFYTVKPFVYPEETKNIIDDSQLPIGRIGVQIEQNYIIPDGNWKVAKAQIKIKNISGTTLKDLAIGFFYDWDIGPNSDSNKVALFPEAIPESFKEKSAAAELAQYVGDFPVFAVGVISNEINTTAQAAGLSYDITQYFSKDNQIASLNSGTAIQESRITDVSMVLGMRFNGNIEKDEEHYCEFCFGGAETKEELAKAMQFCLTPGFSNINQPPKESYFNIEVLNNPINENLILKVNQIENNNIIIFIFDILGNLVYQNELLLNTGTYRYSIDISNYRTGCYFIRAISKGNVSSKSFIIVK